MHIEIAGRFRPFSHRPGTRFLLPKSSVSVQVFPGRLILTDLAKPDNRVAGEYALDVEGPVDDFTVLQDLEKMQLLVWGHAKKGYFRYRIEAVESVIELTVEKGEVGLSVVSGVCEPCSQQAGCYRILFPFSQSCAGKPLERLSLGNHKAQNACLMGSRMDFAEILPLWHRLGQVVPFCQSASDAGMPGLLKACEKAVIDEPPERLLSRFRSLFLAGFDSWLSPRLMDADFQGIVEAHVPVPDESALSLLSQGGLLIRSLFVQQKDDAVVLLPALPKEMHCGRLVDVVCGDWGALSIEWSKKAIKKVILKAFKTRQISLVCTKEEKVCRQRTGHKDRGVPYQTGSPVDIVAGQTYWFDNFQR